MRLELALAAYAAVLTVAAPRLLSRVRWLRRSPRSGIAGWQVTSLTLVLTVAGIGLVPVVPTGRVSGGLSGFLKACALALQQTYLLPGGALTAAVGAALALGVLARTGWCVAAELLSARRDRAMHREALTLVGRADDRLDAVVVEHASRTAYCLPGRHSRIVLTSAALQTLDEDELDAVLAHERAHLSGHHHLVLALANSLARAFPFVPLFVAARREVAVLVEMLADDEAARRQEHLVVASALVALGSSAGPRTGPVVALTATGTATAIRVRRLLAPARPLRRSASCVLATAGLLVVTVPVVLALLPAVALANSDYCPVSALVTQPTAPPGPYAAS